MNRILEIGTDAVRVEAGVTLLDLDAALARAGKYYPPSPTFTGAFVGGVIATNAAGAATSSTERRATGCARSPWCCRAATSWTSSAA
jgi:FAD/FMN-containing dehydrogenase